MQPEAFARLGEPSLRIGGLRLWVHGREFPQCEDFWDGNWLRVTACYRSPASWTSASGPILHVSELARFLAEMEGLYESLTGTATLRCIEPYLRVEMEGNGRGQIEVEVLLTPDPLLESHRFLDHLDQTQRPPILKDCRRILDDHPLRGTADPGETAQGG